MRKAAMVLALSLASCGSDSSAPTPAPTPTPTAVNVAPAFSSPVTASLVENSTAVAYQATASDANGDPITFVIAGGADTASFGISASGALRFVTPPNFDAPGDANRDNVYEVQLRASDGTLSSTLDLRLSVTNSDEGVGRRLVTMSVREPLVIAPIPGSTDRFFLGVSTGNLFNVDAVNGNSPADLNGPSGGSGAGNQEMGLLGVAALPDYATSRLIFVHRTRTDFASEIIEYNINTRVSRVLLTIPHRADNPFNYGGWMGFGPDGLLYVTTGDGGGLGDPDGNAQNPNSLLGKVLRIRVDRTGGTTRFLGAPGNPYLNGGGNPFVFALGLQNPRRASFDGNRLIIAELSEVDNEELNLLPLDQPGLNFGWPYLDGVAPYRGSIPAGLALTPPALVYPHSAGPWRPNSVIGSILGGHVYNGPIASLQGQYLFADYWFGNVYTIPASSLVQGRTLTFSSVERRTADFRLEGAQIAGFGQDGAGRSYVVTLAGPIYSIEPS